MFFASISFSQPKTNLELFYELIDSSVSEFSSKLPESSDSIKLKLNLGETYSVFNNQVVEGIYSSGKHIISERNENGNRPLVNYVIDDVKVEYGEIFRDGFFGDYHIPRNLSLKGNYLIVSDITVMRNFYYSSNDTIRIDEVTNVENESYPFTKGSLPAEPFFSGLFEPLVTLSTTALAIILFFSIRSK